MTPEKLPQLQGLPTGSGGTKHIPAEVEHLELAWDMRVRGAAGFGANRSEGWCTPGTDASSTEARPTPARATTGKATRKMGRMAKSFRVPDPSRALGAYHKSWFHFR